MVKGRLQKLSKKELSEFGKQAALAKRSPELQNAYKNILKIKMARATGMRVSEIAEQYNINARTVYRMTDDS
jgi:predicted DNA-binding transcriptional regulator